MANIRSWASTFDAELELSDNGTAHSATAAGEVDAAAAYVDFGPAFRDGGDNAAYWQGWFLVKTDTAPDDADGNETYVVDLEVATDSAFSSPVTVASVTLTRGTTEEFKVPVHNQVGGVKYRYARAYATLGGTTPSLQYEAFLSNA